ncbi:unnamed protein product [Medioppia subpectinata]|uniref:Uncharacterized protein n=1 Tax=Medioppia subpectinata TaxID=1979941 RepID=A0A7R9LT83_9ACAR|nr:unnamed protein product [Medioppia subpectinata]CAG2121488.1 unnamed protein product [Medioppia subpectinata]
MKMTMVLLPVRGIVTFRSDSHSTTMAYHHLSPVLQPLPTVRRVSSIYWPSTRY